MNNDDRTPTFADALALATKCHDGQRRWNGDPYITHPIAVAKELTGKAKMAAILHDVVEDTDMTIAKLRKLRYHDDVVQAVLMLTHIQDMSYRNYILNIGYNKIAIVVKIKDLEHNLSDLKKGHRRDKYELALHFLKMRYWL